MFKFRETVFSGKNAIKKNVEEKTFYLPKAGLRYGDLFAGRNFDDSSTNFKFTFLYNL